MTESIEAIYKILFLVFSVMWIGNILLFRSERQIIINPILILISSLLVFLPNTGGVLFGFDIEDIKSMQIELKRMGYAFVICYFERKLRGLSVGKTSAITIVEAFSRADARDMQSRLNDYITDNNVKKHIQENFQKSF